MKKNSTRGGGSSAAGPNPQPLMRQGEPTPLWLRLSPLCVVVAVFVVYFRVLGFDFVDLDDIPIIRLQYFIIGHLSNIPLAFTRDAFLGTSGTFYRPLQTVSFMIDAFIGGPGPLVYHLTNLLLHATASLCVFLLLFSLGYKRLPCLLLALLFSLHPMFVLMVGWVPTRGDLLLTIFVTLSFFVFVKSLKENKPILVPVHGVLFFLAFLSKETGIVVPALCLSYYHFELRKSSGRKLLYQFLIVWPLAGGAWYYLRSLLHSGELPANSLGLVALARNLRILPELLGKFLVPVHFQLVPLFSVFDTAVGVMAVAVVTWLIIRTGQRSNTRIHLGLLWFLLCLSPVMVFRNFDAAYIFDYFYHRAYLPSVGLMIVLAELFSRICRPEYVGRVAVGACATLVYFAGASFHELGYYSGALRFFTEGMRRTPRNAMCYNNRGVHYSSTLGNHEAALVDFNKAIEIYPGYLKAILNRAVTLEHLGRNREAIGDLQWVLGSNPNDPDIIFRMGDLRYLLNDFTGALADYNRVLGMNKLYPRIYSKRAGSQAMLGDPRASLRDAEQALEIDPKDEEAYNSRGLAKRLLGDLDAAKADFSEAIRIKKDYSRPYSNRGTIYLAQGNPEKAIEDFSKAIELDKGFAEAYSNRGSVEHQLGKDQAALKDLDEALRLNPDFVDAYQNRGVVKNVLRQFREALADFNQAIKLRPENGGVYLGRGISKHYLEDRAGACEDWKRASSLGSKEAAALLAEYCK
jgi:tetratricopeptide (TPR) repeat protein